MRQLGALLVLALALAGMAAPAASAQTIVRAADVGTGTLAQTGSQSPALRQTGSQSLAARSSRAEAVPYEGGPVLHSNRTHLIFWQPSGSGLSFDPGYIALVEQFLTDVAADSHSTANEYGITGQYRDDGGPAAYASTYGGAVLDSDSLPPNECLEPVLTGPPWTTCLTDAQLQTELLHVIATDHLPTGPTDIYFLMTPRGFGDCADSGSSSCALGGSATGYCGYHSETASGVLYAVIPYNAMPGHCQSGNPRPNGSTADPSLSTLSHEQAEIVTDPLGDAWVDSSGNEIADVCITSYGPTLGGTGDGAWDETIDGHHYWLQELYSRVQRACEPRPQPDAVAIGVRGSGRTIQLTGNARVPGGSVASYSWSYGDGRRGHGHRTAHAYQRTGSYKVVLQITDSAGNWARATRTVRVTPASARDRRHARHPARSRAARSPGSDRTTSR